MGNGEDYETWQKGRGRLRNTIIYTECLAMSPHTEPGTEDAPVGRLHGGAEKPSRRKCGRDIYEKDCSVSF